jgi:hypothetical protein
MTRSVNTVVITMPFQIVSQPGFLRVVITGRLTRDEVMAVGLAVREIEVASERVPHRITDVSGVEMNDLTGEDIHNFARRRREVRYPNPFRNAIFAPQPVQFGYARMFQTLVDHPDIDTQVFNDEAAAIAWLTGDAGSVPIDPYARGPAGGSLNGRATRE